MAYDKFQAKSAAVVTPSDTVDIPNIAGPDIQNEGCVLYIGTSGDIKVTTVAGNDVTFVAHPAGYMPVQVKRVWATGTSASDILALW